MSALLAEFSALLYRLGDFAGGYASRKGRLLPFISISQAASVFMGKGLGSARIAGPTLAIMGFDLISAS